MNSAKERIELKNEKAQNKTGNQNTSDSLVIILVAGKGFEPMTFGL